MLLQPISRSEKRRPAICVQAQGLTIQGDGETFASFDQAEELTI